MEDLSEPLEQFPRENPKGIHPELGDGHRRVGDRGGWGLGWVARRWDSVRPVEAGMDPPPPAISPSGLGTRMFSLSILRSWTLAPSGGLARGASRGCVGAGTLRATHL